MSLGEDSSSKDTACDEVERKTDRLENGSYSNDTCLSEFGFCVIECGHHAYIVEIILFSSRSSLI